MIQTLFGESRRNDMSKKLVFLGGTCAGNNWRPEFIAALIAGGLSAEEIFNPVVPDWNEEVRRKEEEAKASATHMLFYIADPKQAGNPLSAYSMVEATMAMYDKPDTTVVVFDNTGIEGHALKAMNQTLKVLKKRFPAAAILATPAEAIASLTK
jgi:hypothetical protein